MNNQKSGITALENLLSYYNLPYELIGNKYPVNITNMNILGVKFANISAWDVNMFHEFVDHLKACIEDIGMTAEQLKKELFAYSYATFNIDELIESMPILLNMIKSDFKRENMHALSQDLKFVYNNGFLKRFKNIALYLRNLDKLSMSSDEFNDTFIRDLTIDLRDFYMFLAYETCQKSETLAKIEKRIMILNNIIRACGFNSREYVKESYQNSKAKLISLLAIAMNDCKLAKDKFDAVYNERITHEFKSTESAFLYKDYYITPCILQAVIKNAWDNLTKDYQKEYLRKYYNGSKADIKTIASDCLNDMFNKNDISRLNYLDDLRGITQAV